MVSHQRYDLEHSKVGFLNLGDGACVMLVHCDKIIRVPLRYTAADFATIPLPSHTLRAAWANLQAELPVSEEVSGEDHHVLHRVPRFTISMSESRKGNLFPYR